MPSRAVIVGAGMRDMRCTLRRDEQRRPDAARVRTPVGRVPSLLLDPHARAPRLGGGPGVGRFLVRPPPPRLLPRHPPTATKEPTDVRRAVWGRATTGGVGR